MKTIKGEFFLANEQEVKIPGILTINEENGETSLQLFSDERIIEKFDSQFLNGISGLDRITILNCFVQTEEVISSKLWVSKYTPHFLFYGCDFNSKEELKFKSVKISLTHLGNWLEAATGNLFKLEFPKDCSFSAKCIPREDINIKLNGECILTFQRSWSAIGGMDTSLKVDIKHYAVFTFEEHQPFDVFLNLTARLQNILMLFIGSPLSIKQRTGYSEQAIDANNINRQKLEDYPIEIYNYDVLENEAKTRLIPSNQMLITLRHFSIKEISQFIQKWFEDYEKYESVYDIFFHAIKPFWKREGFTISNVTYNNAFLNVVQALESYHRIKTNDSPPDNKDFNNKKEKIMSDARCLTVEQKDFIKNNLVPKKKREQPLKSRIEELIQNKNIFDTLFGSENDVADNLVKWRDSLTHINHKKITDVQVSNWFYKAQVILVVNIFLDLGLEEDRVTEIILSSNLLNQ